MKSSPARTAAFDILLRIETDKAFSSVLLPIYEEGLVQVDRSFCHELTLGTLRRQSYLDRITDSFSGGKRLDIEVRIALRLALYQLFYLAKIPHYSAINESVNLIQRAKKSSAKGFVNAILRRASVEKAVLGFVDEFEQISVENSHPRWLIEKWADEFGIDESARIAAANNEIANTAFRLIGQADAEVKRLVESSQPSKHVEDCYIAKRDESQLFSLAQKDKIYIQDEASQMVAQAVEIPQGGRFLDVCAAPGGKTGMIAKHGSANSNLIVAGDLHRMRVEFLRDNCRHQSVDANIVQYDAERGLPFGDASFDAVLVDAPCSGTGTIRRNPEIRYFLNPRDFAELSTKQLSILKKASKLVCSGGTLIYSTCSLEKEENEEVCRQFLLESADFQLVKPPVPDIFVTDDGMARTWPHRDNMDGFFFASFKRL